MKKIKILLLIAIIPFIFISCNNEKGIVIPQSTKEIKVEYVGSQKSKIITDKSIINNLASILNGVDYKIITDEDEGLLMASSAGGISITLDGNNEYEFYITSAFTKRIISFSETLQRNLKLTKSQCYITELMSNEINDILKENSTNLISDNG